MDIQHIGQQLLNELNEELTKSNESVTLAKGAIQGVQMFYTRLQNIMDGEKNAEESSSDAKASSNSKKSKK